ncbi:MAG: hypothetical protein AB1641_17590 [Thermodesulfobacteriota bacterium]
MIEAKLNLLDRIDQVFDDFVRNEYGPVCQPGCSVCCTADLVGTTLEAWRLLQALEDSGRRDLLAGLPEAVKTDLFRPRVTTNTLALACLSHQEAPLEAPQAEPRPCLFLENSLCPVYASRPFSCRGMLSLLRCRPGGEAEVPPELVIVVSVVWQIIEHLDAGGLYGHMYDLMSVLSDRNNVFNYVQGRQLIQRGLPPTKPLPGFLVPPDQAETVGRFLSRLLEADCGGRTFRQCVTEVRPSPF